MRSEISVIEDPAERTAHVHEWIADLQREISQSPGDPAIDLANLALADLYNIVGSSQQALDVLDEVLTSATDPGTRLRATLDAAATSLLSGYAIEDGLAYTDSFAEMVEQYREQGVEYPSAFDLEYERVDLTRANLLTAAADWLTTENPSMSASAIADMTGPLLTQAASHLGAYAQSLSELGGDPVSQENAAMQYAQTLTKAASLYEAADRVDFARDLHADAARSLEALLQSYPNTRHAQNAATLLLHSKSLTTDSLQEYVEYAARLAQGLTPGHEFLSFLRADALNLARDARSLVASNELLDLVLALEKRWFADEYTKHVNYQWALVAGARNALKMGDLEGAGWRIEELRQLPLQGTFFLDRMVELERTYEDYLRGSFAKDEDDKAVFADRIDTTAAPVRAMTDIKESKDSVPDGFGDAPASLMQSNNSVLQEDEAASGRRWKMMPLVILAGAATFMAGLLFIIIKRRTT